MKSLRRTYEGNVSGRRGDKHVSRGLPWRLHGLSGASRRSINHVAALKEIYVTKTKSPVPRLLTRSCTTARQKSSLSLGRRVGQEATGGKDKDNGRTEHQAESVRLQEQVRVAQG